MCLAAAIIYLFSQVSTSRVGSHAFGTSRRLLVQLIIDAVVGLAVRVLFMVGRPQIVAAFVNPGRFHQMAPPQVLFQHRVGCITVAPGRAITS
jgi:hypothetical protein